MRRERYKSSVAFIDLLFNITIGLAMLFIIAFLLINPIAKKGDIIIKAEFIITMSWPKESRDDIDLYVMDPQKVIVYFRQRDKGLLHLDRDDLGYSNDVVVTDSGSYSTDFNEEHVTIRGIVPGEYIVNAHWFGKGQGRVGEKESSSETVEVKIKIEKLNPYKLIWTGSKTLTDTGDETTFLRFTIDNKGDVISSNELEYPMVLDRGKN
tara:strand:+ start:4783 stop:5409 length:627 start_codon:yes stop_codon:yes gene_type:complete